ncbi:MAG: VOC family protein [Pseudomonadota bacterium]
MKIGEDMVFEKIDRVAIAVRDLEAARSFFSELLGIHFDEPLSDEELKMRAVYSPFGLDLVEATEPNSLIDNIIRERGEGILSLVIKVTDIQKAVKVFEEKGLRRIREIKAGGLTEIVFHPKGAHGVQIVLAEYTAKHPATVAALKE